MKGYRKPKFTPLTPEEIEEKYADALDEKQEVLTWEKEEKEKLQKNNFKTPQAKAACKRALAKIEKRKDSVKGLLLYWGLRKKGKSHFYASIEINEYWAKLKERKN